MSLQNQQRLNYIILSHRSQFSLWNRWTFNVEKLQPVARCTDQSWQRRSKPQSIIVLRRSVSLQCYVRSVGKVATQCRMRLRRFVFITRPNVNIVGIAFGRQQFSVHWWGTNYRDFTWMTDDLLYFDVRVLFSRIVVENWLELWDKVVVFLWDLNIRQHNVIRIVCPSIFIWIVKPVSFTRKVNSLVDNFGVLTQKRTPLNRCRRPVQKILVHKMIKLSVVFSPHAVRVQFFVAHTLPNSEY